MEQYAHIEDLFGCSGMCRPSLFYYGRPISEGYPEKTCLAELHEYLAESLGEDLYWERLRLIGDGRQRARADSALAGP